MRVIELSLALVLTILQTDPAALSRQAEEAARKGDLAAAVRLATRVVEAAPKAPESWLLRARLYDLHRDHAKAAADYGRAIKLDPKRADAWQRRGEANFRAGKVVAAISDFDAYLRLLSQEKPHHWQRGIALYEAGRFAEGKQQFALHQTVNSQDVENAVWHFLCTARSESLEAARKQLIPITGDPRVPMAEVHRLFAGAAKPEEVLAAAEAVKGPSAGSALFYAHLYLGLYYEAVKDASKSASYLEKAAARANENGYMGDVARVHWERVKKMKTLRAE